MVEVRELERIRFALSAAKSELVMAAAALQAKGVDTSTLAGPVIRISDAVAHLEALLNQSPVPPPAKSL